MGLPAKRRTNRSKRDRNSHAALKTVTTSVCPKCQASMLPHRACPACGTYRGKAVVGVEKRAARALRRAKSRA